MAEQLLTVLIQILFPLALLKFTVWSMLIRPLVRRARRHRPVPLEPTRQREPRQRQPRPRHRRRQRHPAGPDPLEAAYLQQSPYVETPLSDELQQAVGILLVLYGTLGVDATELAAAVHQVDKTNYLRAVTRIKATAERLAEVGIDDNLAATGYMLELADRLRGLNRMRALQ